MTELRINYMYIPVPTCHIEWHEAMLAITVQHLTTLCPKFNCLSWCKTHVPCLNEIVALAQPLWLVSL